MPFPSRNSPVDPHPKASPVIGLFPAQFEKRRADTRAGWGKLNPGKPYPEKMFDLIWLGMDRIALGQNSGTWVLERLDLGDGSIVYCIFSPDRTRASLYNLAGDKIAKWTDPTVYAKNGNEISKERNRR